uniref:Ig-like domain-containing protein n=1 Tax=Poecilia latipinna TaxID=48699 RepID=A0A3B3U5I7_9TELE
MLKNFNVFLFSANCTCPKIPPKSFTVQEDGCFEGKYRYKCIPGYTRKPTTSSLIKCEEKNGVSQWGESNFECISKILLFLFHFFKRNLYHVSAKSFISKEREMMVKRPQEVLSLSCRGSGFDFSRYVMNWIRQPAGKTLEWMGAISDDGSNTAYSSRVDGRIEITRENSNSLVHLKLSNLKPEDSAVYYCARDAQ